MRLTIAAAVLIALAGSPAMAQNKEPLVLRDMGSFHIGGRLVEISGKPVREVDIGGARQKLDPNGTYLVEQMYVQYLLPQKRKGKVPLLMWHGGGFTGVTYESTPDGREGWLSMFVRKGWDAYVSDAVERGRAGWAMPDVFKGDPVFLTVDDPVGALALRRSRQLEPRPGQAQALSGQSVPARSLRQSHQADRAALDLRPTGRSWRPTISSSTRSAPACSWCTASPAPSATRRRSRIPTRSRRWSIVEGTIRGNAETAAKLKNVPILVVYGDNVEKSKMFSGQRENNIKMAALAKAAGGSDRDRQPSGPRHPRQFPFHDDGKEQRPDRRRHQEVAGEAGPL